MSNDVFNFNFLALVFSEILGRSQIYYYYYYSVNYSRLARIGP